MSNNSADLFALALGLQAPWEVKNIRFEEESGTKELHIEIDFKYGSQFPNEHGELCGVHDTKQKTWRHLNFFEYHCYLTCRVPRIKTKDGKVRQVVVPWARPGSGFTLLFEAFVMSLIEREMPVNKIGTLLEENAHRLWTIFNYWINKSYQEFTPGKIEKIGVDETSSRRGHKYITVAVDLDERRVFRVVEGKGKDTIKQVKNYLERKGSDPSDVKHLSLDMSPSFIAGIRESFPNAALHFDKFHIVQLLNRAMDEVRRAERKEHKALSGYRYLFLKNKNKLTTYHTRRLNRFIKIYPVLGKAYRLKEIFYDLWEMDTEENARKFIQRWCKKVEDAKIIPFISFAKTVRTHLSGIVNFNDARISNGVLEGINSLIQLAKRRARGFRNINNLINMVYFLCGKLKFDYPHNSS